MIIDDVALDEARDRADAALRWRDEDGRWAVLREMLEGESERQREQMIRMLTLEALRDALYPGIDRKRWATLGWGDVLSGRKSVERFIHDVRLAKAAGASGGKL